jgi:uncharacterized protein DUF4349
MERFRDDADLAATLRALRPTPCPAFAAELDERAAAGFPRRADEESTVQRLLSRARALRPRQVLLPAGATTLAAIVVATAVVAVDQSGTTTQISGDLDGAGGGSPLSRSKPERLSKAGAGVAAENPSFVPGRASSGVESSAAEPLADSAASLERGSGPFASDTDRRRVERSAAMVLGTEAAEVGDAAREVFGAVHASDGIVLRSSIRDGAVGEAGAEFDLLIPSAKLGDALAAFSGIGTVVSRHEATADITAPTVNVGERLRDSRARIDGLLAQLAEADTESEREAVEAELHGERRRAAALRSRLANLQRRANLSRVSLRIETGASAAAGDGSTWGIGDALGDAGRILAIAGAVAVIALAVLAPIALIALLTWLAHRAWLRRGRERALG